MECPYNDGDKVSCDLKAGDYNIEGEICIEDNRVYILHDESGCNGSGPHSGNNRNYSHAWFIADLKSTTMSWEDHIRANSVRNLKLLSSSKFEHGDYAKYDDDLYGRVNTSELNTKGEGNIFLCNDNPYKDGARPSDAELFGFENSWAIDAPNSNLVKITKEEYREWVEKSSPEGKWYDNGDADACIKCTDPDSPIGIGLYNNQWRDNWTINFDKSKELSEEEVEERLTTYVLEEYPEGSELEDGSEITSESVVIDLSDGNIEVRVDSEWVLDTSESDHWVDRTLPPEDKDCIGNWYTDNHTDTYLCCKGHGEGWGFKEGDWSEDWAFNALEWTEVSESDVKKYLIQETKDTYPIGCLLDDWDEDNDGPLEDHDDIDVNIDHETITVELRGSTVYDSDYDSWEGHEMPDPKKEQRWKEGDEITFKSHKDANGYYYHGGSDRGGIIGTVYTYRSYNRCNECWEIQVEFDDDGMPSNWDMIESEFEEYDNPDFKPIKLISPSIEVEIPKSENKPERRFISPEI